MSSEVDLKNQKRKPSNAQQARTSGSGDTPVRIRRERGENRTSCDYSEVPSDVLHRLLCAITARGCAVQFGYTRDGGAFAVRIVGDGEPYTEFIKPTEDVPAAITSLAEDYEL